MGLRGEFMPKQSGPGLQGLLFWVIFVLLEPGRVMLVE